MEDPTVSVEQPTPESAPETTPVEEPSHQDEAPAEQQTEEPAKPTEERPSRADERIRDTIAKKKEAERMVVEKTQEADYWKAQALANRPTQTEDYTLEGVTDEGIDPVTYAKSLEKRLEEKIFKKMEERQGVSQTQAQFNKELYEAKSDPVMKSEAAQRAVSRIIDADKVSPLEALAIYKEEQTELEQERSLKSKSRNEAGQFVRQETSTPSTGRGTNSSTGSNFTREQVDTMSLSEYEKNRDEINRQMAAGLIK